MRTIPEYEGITGIDLENQDDFDELIGEEADRADWPRSCPVIHLNIEQDFPLDAHKKLLYGVYRFWVLLVSLSIFNCIALTAASLSSPVTNPLDLIQFLVITLFLYFVMFGLYFRPLYWALRNDLKWPYFWFYLMSILLWLYQVLVISSALGTIALLIEPLAPGSPLPVKVSPIFPVTAFAVVVLGFVYSACKTFFFFSSAYKWHFTTAEETKNMLKEQHKSQWMLFSGRGGDDDNGNSGSSSSGFPCIVMYDQIEQQLGKNEKHGRGGETLTVAGTITVDTTNHVVNFRADEAIFDHRFCLRVWLGNVTTVRKKRNRNGAKDAKDVAEIHIIEKMCVPPLSVGQHCVSQAWCSQHIVDPLDSVGSVGSVGSQCMMNGPPDDRLSA